MAKRFLSQVRGMDVVGAAGHVFGEIVDVELADLATVSGIVIRVRSANLAKLGIKKPFWSRARLVIPAKSVRAIDDVVILRISLDQFAARLKAAEAEKTPASKATEAKPVETKPAETKPAAK